FRQRLQPDFYRSLQDDMRARMIEAGLSLLLVDHHQDVAYATGFQHYPNERPVAFALTRDGGFLLIPELERDYAQLQRAVAEPVVYAEFPGVDRPFDVLARAVGRLSGRAGYSGATASGRVREIKAAFAGLDWQESAIVDDMRLMKRPEEIVLHREASRISD